MKNIANYFLLLILGTTGCIGIDSDISDEDYRLVWADEFDQDGTPNPANWGFEEGFRRNREIQWYQPENAFVENGKLIIEAKREVKPNPNYVASSNDWRKQRKNIQITSSSLLTKDKFSWQYGRFEIRAKITAEDGLWPAIWFLGEQGQWPKGGEIDLMEYYQGMILANVAWGDGPIWDSARIPLAELGDENWDQQFHIWRMDWDATAIRLYVDNKLLNTTLLSETINPPGNWPSNPFKQPHYLLINLAIGGDKGGDPNKATYPSRYEIDYVRVYQKDL